MTYTTATATAVEPPPGDPIAAIEAGPLPFDLYREVHKSLRLALFDSTLAVGAADHRDPTARRAAAARVGHVVDLLHAHHGHEDAHIQPLLMGIDPRLAALTDSGHAEIDAQLTTIERVRAALVEAHDPRTAVVTGHALFGRLSLFAATYLAHMALEEGAVMDALRAARPTAELFAVEMAIRTSIAPPVMADFVRIMAPAMNVDERTAMLGGLRAGAPAEVFDALRAVVEGALDPADYRAVAERIGVA